MSLSMSPRLSLGAAFAAALAFAAPSALAQQAQPPSPIVTSLSALIVGVNAAGQETLTPSVEAAPGDVIEYRLVATNVSTNSLQGVVVSSPIPASLRYVADSASAPTGQNIEVSIDSGETWEREPVRRLRQNAEGQMVQVIVPASEYTNLRWVGAPALQPNQAFHHSYRAQMD